MGAGSATADAMPDREAPEARAVRDALGRLGFRVRRLALLSPPDPMKRGRSTHRAWLEDGRSVKARHLESAEEARRLFALEVEPAEHFVRPIAHDACVLVEPWIEGTALGPDAAATHAGEAGALLGRLHESLVPGSPTRLSTQAWRTLAREELARLGAAGTLTATEVRSLEGRLDRDDPGSARAGLVHCDFRPENLLVDPQGVLRVVDNEWLRIDPACWDLARTFAQWPMSEPVRAAFLRGYRTTAQDDALALAFWDVMVALWTLRIRRDDTCERLAGPIALLRRAGRT